MRKTVAVLTPTYNRGYILNKLFESLHRQTCFDFKWYIVDDGSTDNTKELCETFETENFEIVYIYKENGGKHTAINAGVSLIEEELTFIVDSDDYLTDDAVETIVFDWKKHKNNPMIGGLSYYRLHEDRTVIGDVYNSEQELVDTYINVRINGDIKGDKAELYKTDLLRKCPFPVFEGERFLSEAVVWSAISEKGYKLVFINKGIYICEYRNDGLTKEGRIKIKNNPNGTVEHAKAFLRDDIKQIIQWKYSILYVVASVLARKKPNEAYRECPKKLKYICAFPFGIILLVYWTVKWRKLK